MLGISIFLNCKDGNYQGTVATSIIDSNLIQPATEDLKSSYRISSKPLDFSFLDLTDINSLRKEVARSGNRKKIPESEDEEDMKKVSNSFTFIVGQNETAKTITTDENNDEGKEKGVVERVLRAKNEQALTKLLADNNISLQVKNGSGISE